ncbi:DNA -binding domain-containing protein [Phenylobacterium sp.]|uniref:DNA -binding domain-containing protein n=1 Tax=Phenylobacterium sp. TaxID=1871053 RepID=UPI003BA9C72D
MGMPSSRRDREELRSARTDGSARPKPNRADFAWEFLRRNLAYRTVAKARVWTRSFKDPHGEEAARPWGLQFIADPDLPAGVADVFWRPEVAPSQVVILERSQLVMAAPLQLGGNIALQRRGTDGLHVRLQTGVQALVRDGDLTAPLAVVLPISGQFSAALRAAQGLQRTLAGATAPQDDLRSQLRQRLVRALAAFDGAGQGWSYREIATEIFGSGIVAREAWRTSTVRDATIRLVRAGRLMVAGGYRSLLRGDKRPLVET